MTGELVGDWSRYQWPQYRYCWWDHRHESDVFDTQSHLSHVQWKKREETADTSRGIKSYIMRLRQRETINSCLNFNDCRQNTDRLTLTSEKDEQKTFEWYEIHVDELLLRQIFLRVLHLLRWRRRSHCEREFLLLLLRRMVSVQPGRSGVVYYADWLPISCIVQPTPWICALKIIH